MVNNYKEPVINYGGGGGGGYKTGGWGHVKFDPYEKGRVEVLVMLWWGGGGGYKVWGSFLTQVLEILAMLGGGGAQNIHFHPLKGGGGVEHFYPVLMGVANTFGHAIEINS